MNNVLSKRNIFISVLLISISALFFGAEQGFNMLTVNSSLQVQGEGGFIFANHHLTLFFFLGTFIGIIFSSIASYFADRKKTFLSIILLMFITLVLNYYFHNPETRWIYKILFGIIAGSVSFLVPIYITELSPANKRGSYIATFELMITGGILLVIVLKFFERLGFLSDIKTILLPVAIIFVLCLFYLNNSLRWISFKKRKHLISSNNLKLNISGAYRKQTIFKVLLLGIAIQALQQLSGINAMIYYSTRIFNIVGFDSPLFDTAAIVAVKAFATLLAINLIDSIGRKHLLFFGFTLMGMSMIFCGILFASYSTGDHFYFGRKLAFLFCTLIHISAFALSIGPIAWLLSAEIFPTKYRNAGVAVTTLTNWILNAVIIFSSISIIKNYNISLIFMFFGICCFVGLFVVAFFIPETRNIELEEIEQNLKNDIKLRNIGEPEAVPYEFTEFK
jgi:MFS transporter, SP family, galactose:H+ symporter